METPETIERTASEIVDASVQLHKAIGPGLLENVYETVLARRLEQRGLKVARQCPIPFSIDGTQFAAGFRADLIVNECVIAEIKSIESLAPVHSKQLLTYLRLTGLPLGLLVNFGGATLKSGLRRVLNGYQSSFPSCLRAKTVVGTHTQGRG